ncbi:alpha/beta fold hydrolase [Noviherbaspirillum malthae]|uniref:alpha/beta fold hydrolase n=1 Tax=Noviherbaspirillum malthae TaxID=1260987 RepID=UPI00188E41FD|nr:alpha/beta fold hydrolase [Noviherbaspirillum malthae]
MRSYLHYHLKRLKRGLLARMALWSHRAGAMLGMEQTLPKLEFRLRPGQRDVIVFFPGIGDIAEDFDRRGFIREMERQGITADAMAVDAHYGYYAARTIHHRITDDVIASARRTGYRRIWLAGISLGGFGVASYAALHSSRLAGIILLAPYLGPPALIAEIAAAGSLAAWEPGQIEAPDHQRQLWAWFRQRLTQEKGTRLPIYLGYGRQDMFAAANRLLADALPAERVFLLSGGHNWRTWRRLWRTMLSRLRESDTGAQRLL